MADRAAKFSRHDIGRTQRWSVPLRTNAFAAARVSFCKIAQMITEDLQGVDVSVLGMAYSIRSKSNPLMEYGLSSFTTVLVEWKV
jgi:hypothetical protein